MWNRLVFFTVCGKEPHLEWSVTWHLWLCKKGQNNCFWNRVQHPDRALSGPAEQLLWMWWMGMLNRRYFPGILDLLRREATCQKSNQKLYLMVPEKDHRKGQDLNLCVAWRYLTVSVPAYSHLFIWSSFKVNIQAGFHSTLWAVPHLRWGPSLPYATSTLHPVRHRWMQRIVEEVQEWTEGTTLAHK